MIITSRDNQTIKEIIKLKDKKYRDKSFIVEGIKESVILNILISEVKFNIGCLSPNKYQ